jgi:hypothetical protein
MVETTDSLDRLRTLLRLGGTITKVSENPVASNGLPYCYVEITDTAGTHYFIDAYENEALTLYDTAIKIANAK